MKIAVAIERFNPVGSGRERSTFQIVNALLQRGHDVTVLCGDAPDGLHLDRGEIRRSKTLDYKHFPKTKPFALWATAILESGEFESSLSVTTSTPAKVMQPRHGTVKALLRQLEQVPSLASPSIGQRVMGIFGTKNKIKLNLERKAFGHPLVQHVAVFSQRAATELATDYAIEQAKLRVIYNGAQLPGRTSDEREKACIDIRRAFGIDEHAIVFLFAAHRPDIKGLTPLLHGLKTLDADASKVILLVAGEFPFHHQELAASLGVRQQVKVTGITEHMADLFAAADVLIHPSFFDGGSKVVIEAMSVGVPVIASSWDGSSEHVAGDSFEPRGIVLENPNDHKQISDAMRQMLNADSRVQYASATIGLADQLSMARHVDALEELLTA